jgi:hypothetical protein
MDKEQFLKNFGDNLKKILIEILKLKKNLLNFLMS